MKTIYGSIKMKSLMWIRRCIPERWLSKFKQQDGPYNMYYYVKQDILNTGLQGPQATETAMCANAHSLTYSITQRYNTCMFQ
jgi:hypothetical protein